MNTRYVMECSNNALKKAEIINGGTQKLLIKDAELLISEIMELIPLSEA